jgi:hypothetical protein
MITKSPATNVNSATSVSIVSLPAVCPAVNLNRVVGSR